MPKKKTPGLEAIFNTMLVWAACWAGYTGEANRQFEPRFHNPRGS